MEEAVRPAQSPAVREGRLTLFVGYASGCGKTYSMLREALERRRSGCDAVIGLLSPGGWPETEALAAEFEALPPKQWGGAAELDLDGALQRAPQLLIVDDLAHENPEGCRHKRRLQDVRELMRAGIDVYAALDVQHLESLQDTVAAILGRPEALRVPDHVFDRAGRVIFADTEPLEIAERRSRAGRETGLFPAQLSALRELALRRCADRASLYTEDMRGRDNYRTHEHVLVCLSSAPSNAKIIRTAARMAGAFRCSFTALFVETKEFRWMAQADKERLQANQRLAEQLGAAIELVYGDDIAYQIAEFARLSGVTKIVLGRSGISRGKLLRMPSLTERLIELMPELDVHIIPDSARRSGISGRRWAAAHPVSLTLFDFAKSVGLLVAATLVGFLFYFWGFTESNIITVYLLSVLLISVVTKSPVCSLIASIASVLIFNFFFTEPRFSLQAYDSGYPVTFLVMFLTALIAGSLATKLKSLAQKSAQFAWRTRLLFETNQGLQKAKDSGEILSTTARQLVKLFRGDVVVYGVQNGELTAPVVYSDESGADPGVYTREAERRVARWVLQNNRRAGATTDTFSDACCAYFSVRIGETVYGVIGIAAVEKPRDAFESGILLSVLGECALALENQKNAEEKEAAAVLAKNEQLRANLLRTISHDLRTPLTSISGNAGNLISSGDLFDEATKHRMYLDIYDDSQWLINLVENLLSISRLEGGGMHLRIAAELVDEVVAEALRHVSRRSTEYRLTAHGEEEYLLAQIDAKLMVQVLINLIDNAIKYTPPGSEIEITWKREGQFVRISVADDGPGISDEAKPHIFEMFYSAANRAADSRRSLGLGLALCKSIVNAHGGEISVGDHAPHGTVFSFTVPAGEVELHE